MDYCHPCQRHLNGALACPGCGTHVEQLRAYRDAYEPEPYDETVALADHDVPVAPDGHADDGDGREDEGDEPHGRAARRREQGRGGRRSPATAGGATDASRRDRKAALHRRRRKRTLLVAAGFVLAAGGLSLAELGVDAPGFSSHDPSAAGGESEVDRSTAEPSESARPLGDGTGIPDSKSSTSPPASASPSASKSADGEDDATPTGKATRSAAPPGSVDSTPPPASGSTPTSDPTTSDPSPQPSETCKRFLWWCS
ncbi:hypothetical protein OHN37_14520 [Streptomyces sp. NBC_00485]|uniref:SCO2400 family protein n=1 Tax=Streptomyces sp. NBC_00485 TaxID=2975758 RepID=UPI0030DE1D09